MSCPGTIRAEEKVGQPLGSDRPIAERPSYFFFAFLAFLAAFFAFFAIVPPEGSGSCLDGDFGMFGRRVLLRLRDSQAVV
jgi:hypothetical protein